MSYNIFERVQKCWMVFPTFLMKFTMFDGLHRLLTCYITFVQLLNFRMVISKGTSNIYLNSSLIKCRRSQNFDSSSL